MAKDKNDYEMKAEGGQEEILGAGMDEYGVNNDGARQGDSKADRLQDYGAFIGKCDLVRGHVSESGYRGYMLHFNTQFDGSTTFFWMVIDPDGKAMKSRQTLDQLMVVLGVKRLQGEVRDIEVWNREMKEVEIKKAKCYPELEGKDFGVVLSKVIDKEGRVNLNVECIFHPKSNLTASEILDGQTTPKKKDKIIKNMTALVDKREGVAKGNYGEGDRTPLAADYNV